MSMDLSQIVARRMLALPLEDQKKVMDFVEELVNPKKLTLIEKIQRRGAALSDETLAHLPIDGAENLDHYLYGHPKKNK